MMRAQKQLLIFWGSLNPRRRDGACLDLPLCNSDCLDSAQRRPLTTPHRVRSLTRWLVLALIVLAPCGGPCDRCSRPADPSTVPALGVGSASRLSSHRGLNRASDGSHPTGMDEESLLEEENDSDPEGGCVVVSLKLDEPHATRANCLCYNSAGSVERVESDRSTILRF